MSSKAETIRTGTALAVLTILVYIAATGAKFAERIASAETFAQAHAEQERIDRQAAIRTTTAATAERRRLEAGQQAIHRKLAEHDGQFLAIRASLKDLAPKHPAHTSPSIFLGASRRDKTPPPGFAALRRGKPGLPRRSAAKPGPDTAH